MTPRIGEQDLQNAVDLWSRTYGPEYGVSASALSRHQFSHPLTLWTAMRRDDQNALRSFAVIKGSATPTAYPGQDPTRLHLSALGFLEFADGVEAVHSALIAARELGAARLAFAMDADHLLPGVPTTTATVSRVLESCGFEFSGECFDLERDLSGYELPDRCAQALSAAGAQVATCRPDEVSALDSFLAREFPGRWRHDVTRKAVEDAEPGSVYLLWLAGEVEGFAMTQLEGCSRPIGGAVWNRALGARWGALGPIGVSRRVRGVGLGDALLGSALLGLSRAGARQTIIDWTTLDEFYGAHGFEVTRRYRQCAKALA